MYLYKDIEERIEYCRNHPINSRNSERELKYIEYTKQLNPHIAENRTLDDEFRMLLSIYEQNGDESAFFSDSEFHFYHQLPYTGILHKHEFIEFFYVVEGSFEQILMGEKWHFDAGEFVITDQNCEHADYLLPVDAAIVFIQIQSRYLDELLRSYDEKDEVHRFLFHALSRQKKEHSFLHLREIESGALHSEADAKSLNNTATRKQTLQLLELLFTESINQEAGSKEISKGLLIRLLRHLCINYSPNLNYYSQAGKETATLYELERYIRINYANVNSRMLEDVFHYHRNYYNLLLTKYRGKSFKKYLQDIRLTIAEEQLQSTQLSVKEIAKNVGYENTSHFYHLYEEKYGRRPRSE